MDPGKIYTEAHLSSVRRKDRDSRVRVGVEVSIVERRDDFRFESRALRPGSTAIGEPIEADGHGLDGCASLIEHHITIHREVGDIPDVTQVLEGQAMLVSTVIFGNVPNFAVDSYMVFDQGGTTIKPVTVRFDGIATRSAAWPESPRFKAKVIASFNYTDFDPHANTTITVFPANGGESSFRIDFSRIH